jgi:hypothetical protein
MTARKKTATRKKTTRRKTTARTALARLEAEMPKSLREFRGRVSKQLGQLEKDIERAGIQTRRRAAKLIREASHQLGRLEAKGEPGFRPSRAGRGAARGAQEDGRSQEGGGEEDGARQGMSGCPARPKRAGLPIPRT